MKVTLIRPNMGEFKSFDALKPLAIGILSNIAKEKGIDVEFYDDRIEDIPENLDTDLIAISVETFTAQRAYKLAQKYISKGIRVVLGGVHVTLCPEEAKNYATSIAIGDAEDIWPQILDDAKNNELKLEYKSVNQKMFDGVIDQSIFDGKKYGPVELIQFNRGCRFICDFCSIHATYQSNIRARSVESIVEEIKSFDKNKVIFFVDDNLFNNKERLEKLLEHITPLKRKFAAQMSIDMAKSEDLLKKLRQAGFIFVLIGFESLVEENLKQMRKNWNKVAGDYKEVVDRLHKHRISVYGTFVFGYDYDSVDAIKKALSFALESNLEIANFNPLTPTPKTGLYDRLKKEGRLIKEKWWLDNYSYGETIYTTDKYDMNELVLEVHKAKNTFYSWKNIFRRVIWRFIKREMDWDNFKLSMAANIVSKLEIKNKFKKKLG